MKILSISSAAGWFGKYDEDGTIHEYPVACWALVQDAHMKGEADVVGLDLDPETHVLDRCDRIDNFTGYRHESEKGDLSREIGKTKLEERFPDVRKIATTHRADEANDHLERGWRLLKILTERNEDERSQYVFGWVEDGPPIFPEKRSTHFKL